MRALVDARSTLQLFELLLDFRKAQTFRMAKAEKAADVGAVLQEFKRLIPQEIIEVDENVAAQDELHFTEGAVHGEIMAAEGHRVTDVSSNDGRVRARREISGKAALATCCGENLAASADHGQRVDATLRGAQSGAADVRCEDRCAIEQTRLFEQYGERIDLFSGCATGVPDLEARPRPQHRKDVFLQGSEDGCVAKERGNAYRELRQKSVEERFVAEHARRELERAFVTDMRAKVVEAPQQCVLLIIREIVAITKQKSLEEHLQFDLG